MRSQLVFQAMVRVPNPYQLCQLTSKASRGLQRGAVVSTSQAINKAFDVLAKKESVVEPTDTAMVVA